MNDITLLSELLTRSAARVPDRIAVESADGAGALTYRQLSERAQSAARSLTAIGLPSGSRVVMAMDGSPEWAVAFFSVIAAGFVAVPVPAAIPPDLLTLVLHHAEARVCILDDRNPLQSARLPAVLRVTVHALVERGATVAAPPPAAIDPRETAVLVFTSGSTARPRAVELSHANVLANLLALLASRTPAADETLLSVLPPAHVFELVVGQLAPMAIGARVVYAGAPLANRLADAMRDRHATRTLLVPGLFEALLREIVADLVDHGELPPVFRARPASDVAAYLATQTADRRAVVQAAVRARIGHSLQTIAVGGAATASALSDLAKQFGIAVDVGYGLTEAGPVVSFGLTTECPPGSVGRPLPGVSVRIDESGEILVHGPAIMRGYYRDAVGSALALEDRWLRTGDRGYLDDDGFLFVTGRIKEAMVTSSGETLYPDDVEPHYASALFAEHCVVPMTGFDGNDIPTLVVVPSRPGITDADIGRAFAELRKAAPSRFRVPAFVRHDAPLPRTAIGKLRRRAIATTLAAAARPQLAASEA